MKNILDFEITRPTQILIIMRGIPGAGKSTVSRSYNGIVHSTDAIIESLGDYRSFFAKMRETNDFMPLHNAHKTNLNNAIKSMQDGVSIVIIDNTNIKANEPKPYVVEALKMGYDDKNILIIDIGTNGFSAQQLSERNTHGVPLDKIESMIASHKGVGELTVKKILNSQDIFIPKSNVLYSAVVLKPESKALLYVKIPDNIALKIGSWRGYADHMTINMGELKDKTDVGKTVILTVTHIGLSETNCAVKVKGYPSKNEIPHITVGVNIEKGGKPVMSNQITNWKSIDEFNLEGVVTEITKNN